MTDIIDESHIDECGILSFADFVIDLCNKRYFDQILNIKIKVQLNMLKKTKNYFGKLDHPSISKILNNIGNILAETTLPMLALPFFLEQLRIEQYYLGHHHPDLAFTLYKIGHIYESQDESEEAKMYFIDALCLLDFHERKGRLYATLAYNIGLVNYRQSLYEDATEYFKISLIEQHAAYEDFHPAVAEFHMHIGKCQLEIGMIQDALNNFLEAITILRMRFGNDNSKVAECLYGIGLVHETRSEYGESLNALYQALIIVKNAQHDDNAFSLLILHKIGIIYQSMEDTDDEANHVFENVKNIVKSKGRSDNVEEIESNIFGHNIDDASPPAAAAA